MKLRRFNPIALLEQILGVLPVVLLGLLALGSYWLYQQTPNFKAAKAATVAQAEPDYFLKQFATRQFLETGQIKSEVYGEAAFHFPITDEMDIRLIRVKKVQASGQIVYGTSQQALVNHDGSDVQLIGTAKVSQAPARNAKVQQPIEFSGDYLRIRSKDETVSSNRPVLVTRGKEQFSASSLQYDHKTGITNLQGRVSVVLWPQTSR